MRTDVVKSWWKDVLGTFRGALAKWLIGGAVTLLPPAAVLVKTGWDFITADHLIPGWLILIGAGAGGLFVFSVGLNVMNVVRERDAARRTLRIVSEGTHYARQWSMGTRMGPPDIPVMQVHGDFHVTNLTDQNLTVPRTILLICSRFWMLIPFRRQTEGAGVGAGLKAINARSITHERLIWFIEPPVVKRGKTFRARVGLVDNLDNTNWSDWMDWRFVGD